MLEVGAHQLCWLFLQALFMDANAPPTTMTASAISAAVFILSSVTPVLTPPRPSPSLTNSAIPAP